MVKSKKKMQSPAVIIPVNRIFMWAYGSNLNVRQMRERCPKAGKSEQMIVDTCALVFRGVADVTVRPETQTYGGLWTITEDCERSLDRYEGVAGKVYMKRYLRIKLDGDEREHTCLFYQMRAKDGILPPSERYIETIARGYADFDLPLDVLERAVAESWESKEVTEHLHERHMARGMPRLAREVPRVGTSRKERRWEGDWS